MVLQFAKLLTVQVVPTITIDKTIEDLITV
jgi:hypothetical protein